MHASSTKAEMIESVHGAVEEDLLAITAASEYLRAARQPKGAANCQVDFIAGHITFAMTVWASMFWLPDKMAAFSLAFAACVFLPGISNNSSASTGSTFFQGIAGDFWPFHFDWRGRLWRFYSRE
jgi:hypothetical protein